MLTWDEIDRVRLLTYKIRERAASLSELEEFVQLVQQSGASEQADMTGLLYKAGFSSLEDFSRHLQEKKAEGLIQNIAMVGLGILVGYGIYKMLSRRA